MKKFLVFLMLFVITSTFGQKMYIWRNNVITDSMNITNDLKISFKSGVFACGTSTVDYSGNTYHTVLIGSQCWLKENLDVGTRINGSINQINNGVIEKYCYNDSTINCNIYGGLYQWDEALQYVTTQGTQGICPTGWHIPTLTEFQTLETSVGGDGNALKAIGQGSGAGAGTNTSGFSALLAGYRGYGGNFTNLSSYTNFWSSTELNATYAYSMYLYSPNSNVGLTNYTSKEYGFSVRCLKD